MLNSTRSEYLLLKLLEQKLLNSENDYGFQQSSWWIRIQIYSIKVPVPICQSSWWTRNYSFFSPLQDWSWNYLPIADPDPELQCIPVADPNLEIITCYRSGSGIVNLFRIRINFPVADTNPELFTCYKYGSGIIYPLQKRTRNCLPAVDSDPELP